MFNNSSTKRVFQTKELKGGTIHYMSNFMPLEKRMHYYNELKRYVQWNQDSIVISGNTIKLPRKTAWYGTKSYTYSGIKNEPLPMIKPISDILRVLNHFYPYDFNSVLLNHYLDGSHSIGWHSDDEKELGDNPIIASVSIGAVRNFKLKSKDDKQHYDIPLKSGSLLIMGEGIQRNYLHSVPKERSIKDGRINLTFRKIH